MTRNRSSNPLRHFGSDSSGSTAIEFALTFPLLAALMMAIFQISILFIAQQNLENATAQFGRLVRTGQAQEQKVDKAGFRNQLCAELVFFLKCDRENLYVDVKVLPDFGSVPLDWPIDDEGRFNGTGDYQLGTGEEIVLVRTFYQLPIWLPMIGPNLANLGNGKRLLSSASAFRNEPF
jgi:Flp pilus assembly protein TadG